MGQRRNIYVAALVPVPPSGVAIQGTDIISENTNTVTELTHLNNGTPGAVVTLQITHISGSNYPGDQYLYVFGPGNVVLNQTFTVTLDGAGNGTYKTITFAGNRPPAGGFLATITIVAVSAGSISTFASRNYSHTN